MFVRSRAIFVALITSPFLMIGVARAGSLLQIGAGYSSLSYSETGDGPPVSFSESSVLVKTDCEFFSTTRSGYPGFDFGLGAFGTAYSLKSNESGVHARFYGGDVHAGPGFSLVGLRVSLLGGAYFRSMQVTQDEFGYKDVTGPEFFPVLRKSFGGSRGGEISAYGKFTPIAKNARLGLLKFSNRELAAGLQYTIQHRRWAGGGDWKFSSPFSISAEYSTLRLDLDGVSGISKIWTAGVALGF